MIRYEETKFGFNWGSAEITRLFSDEDKEWIIMEIKTPKDRIELYVTKTGKIRVHSVDGIEWKRVENAAKTRNDTKGSKE